MQIMYFPIHTVNIMVHKDLIYFSLVSKTKYELIV